MLVCPACRSENQEEARFCTTCGRSLEPEEAGLVRTPRRDPSEAEIDIPPPRRRSAVPGIIGLVGVMVLALGAGAWWLLKPDPCSGKFSSPQYPYCVEVPQGWADGREEIQGATADTFAPPTFDPVVLVIAEDAEPGVGTEAYAQAQREAQEADGLFPGPVEPVTIGGTSGLAWEITTTAQDGSTIRQRQVAVVEDGRGWIIAYVGAEETFQSGVPQFQGMLESWSWK